MMALVRSAIIDRPRGTGTGSVSRQRDGALGDVDGEVADALELVVDLDDGHDEAQVAGHRLVEREDLEALLLELDLVLVDDEVGGDHPARRRGVARFDGVEGEAQVLLHDAPRPRILRLSLSISR